MLPLLIRYFKGGISFRFKVTSYRAELDHVIDCPRNFTSFQSMGPRLENNMATFFLKMI